MSSYEEDDDFIKVAKQEDSEIMEFPKEEDGTVLLRTIQTQFADAIGIKYKGSSGAWRAVREIDNALVAPKGGWGDQVYTLTFSEDKKRKVDSGANGDKDAKYSRTDDGDSSADLQKDFAVIGLPFETTDSEFKTFFEEKYGEVIKCQIKYDRETGKSRGFGFIRFKDDESAKAALIGENYINGRRVVVRSKREKPMKMYVNGLPEGTTQEELVEYFSKFGRVVDSYVPKPFRSFAFFTFSSVEDGKRCLRERHVFRDNDIKVRIRQEREQQQAPGFGNSVGQRGFNNQGNGGYQTAGYKPRNEQQNYHGRNMPPQPPQQAQSNKAAELKNMLFEFLAS